jgi:hypothetical protein
MKSVSAGVGTPSVVLHRFAGDWHAILRNILHSGGCPSEKANPTFWMHQFVQGMSRNATTK